MQTRIANARDESVPLRLVTACDRMLAPVRVVHWTLVSLCNANLASRRDEGVGIVASNCCMNEMPPPCDEFRNERE